MDALPRGVTGPICLYNRDGALAHERDGHRMGADAVAHDAAGGVGGVEEAAPTSG
jgi:hypothetical protein